MSRTFGPIFQIGYVVKDIDKAIEHFTKVLGIGPFFLGRRTDFTEFSYDGKSSAGIDMAAAHSYSGDIDIEIISQLCDRPSIYQDFFAQGGEGVHHVAVLTSQFDADVARIVAGGHEVRQRGRVATGTRFAYFDTIGPCQGTMMEFVEKTAHMSNFLDRVKAAARDWDGSDPVRSR